jgi:hypothetical protein
MSTTSDQALIASIELDLIVKVLNELTPYEWAVKDSDSITILNDGGPAFGLWLRFGGYGNEGKISISYNRPKNSSGSYVTVYEEHTQMHDPRIRVSDEKSAEQVAKDIVRRLLPESFRVHREVLKSIKNTDTYNMKRTNLRNAIADLCNEPRVTQPFDENQIPTIDPYKNTGQLSHSLGLGYGKIKINADSIDIDLTSVPASLGIELVALIRQAIRRKTG